MVLLSSPSPSSDAGGSTAGGGAARVRATLRGRCGGAGRVGSSEGNDRRCGQGGGAAGDNGRRCGWGDGASATPVMAALRATWLDGVT